MTSITADFEENQFSLTILCIKIKICHKMLNIWSIIQWITVLSTSLGKTFFAWRFILNENILFWLTISCQKPFVFYVSVFCSQIFTKKNKVTAKSLSGLCYFYSKVIFWIFCLRKYFLLFFAEFKLLMFYNNIVKISEKLNKWNLLKIWLQVTYPTDFCMIWLHFYYGKKWKYLIF